LDFPKFWSKIGSQDELMQRKKTFRSSLKEHGAGGASPAGLAQRHGVAEGSIYRQKARLGGMKESDKKRVRQLEAQNRRCKRLHGEAEFDRTVFQLRLPDLARHAGHQSRSDQSQANVPDLHWFASIDDARAIIDTWRQHYNHVRPHRSLGRKPPAVFAKEAA
jgi:transposase InsO family protein